MVTTEATKPESLEEFLKEEREVLAKKYKKILHALHEVDAADIFQFRKGMERIAGAALKTLEERACNFWGRDQVRAAMHTAGCFSLLRDVIIETEKEASVLKRAKWAMDLRTVCGPFKPVPWDAPVEVLLVKKRIFKCFERLKLQTIGQVHNYSHDWRKVPGLGRASVRQLHEALSSVGRPLRRL